MSTRAEQPTQFVPSRVIPATDHLFANNVRFLSMAAVVFVHCIDVSFSIDALSPTGWLIRCLRQPAEFDVIGFFLISGFLMEEGLTRRPAGEYLKRRFQRILTPWLFWLSLYFALLLVNDTARGRLGVLTWQDSALWVIQRLHSCLFSSAYWFVPNLLFALCILLACRRFLFDLRLGSVLLALSLFYGLNIYAHWIPIQNHTGALFGFIFYQWLGALASRNSGAIQAWIARTSMTSLLALALLACLTALLESTVLARIGNPHPMNVLRISNQVYSIFVVLAISKLRKPVWPRIVNVRTTTFGIYLTHIIVLFFLMGIVKRTILQTLISHGWDTNPAAQICFLLGIFAVAYGASLALTKWQLSHPSLRWLAGAASSN
jgi:peptidoglycan/LPS O-acetylase OafA/YrhL